MSKQIHFDDYAGAYGQTLGHALAWTGETTRYFAAGRVQMLARILAAIGFTPRTVLDFGCGTGSSTPHFVAMLGAASVVGVDISAASLAVARQQYRDLPARFALVEDSHLEGEADLAFSNGAFHHIPTEERSSAVSLVFRALRPGGLFALWENSPYNPGTRWIMSHCEFDCDAKTLTPSETRRLLAGSGFRIIRTDFAFIFPRFLKTLRLFEPPLSRLPIGGQYQVLAERPAADIASRSRSSNLGAIEQRK